MSEIFRWERDARDVVVLTMDAPGRSANTLDAAFRAAFAATVERLEAERDEIAGVVLTSAKRTFLAGADLDEMLAVTDEHVPRLTAELDGFKGLLRRLETLGRPVVALLNGSALGGGFELALACHHRICVDDPELRVGLPEVMLGLLPAGGGVTRYVRLLGLAAALPLLLEGKRLRPGRALRAGLLHELAPDVATGLDRAKEWIAANRDARQPWDTPGYAIPGGGLDDPVVRQVTAAAPAMLRKRTHGTLPAPERILAAAVEGMAVDVDTAQRIETRYFADLVSGQVAKNMITAFWFQLNEVNAGRSRPAGVPERAVRRVGVLGSGMMGAGIARVTAEAGIEVVLKDVSAEVAERGLARIAGELAESVEAGRLAGAERDAVLARITPTGSDADLAGCDLVIEAVPENRELKNAVLAAAEEVVAETRPDAVVTSNTSTLPITGLATAVRRPERFCGLHFFSPVPKMPLVEIIRGRDSGDEALATAFDYVRRIGKTPIVVNDGRGFFTSRVFGTYATEGVAMVAEGVRPALVENQARLAGFPVSPLAVSDEVSLSLMWHIREQTAADLAAEGRALPDHPAFPVIDLMVNELGRAGRAAGAGFYDYPQDGPKRLWPELTTRFHRPERDDVDGRELRDRLLFVQALEAVRCLEDGVLTSVADANVGSIMGIGFPPWTGGVLQFVNGYGLSAFVARADELAAAHGERFAPPALLRERAAADKPF
ncbi:3-hydroxyacyl-CoA dehydrogenase / enoyl-CoA hydratase / 3-hydroxybutyryl-CoA epimerase [Streptoalloteichus tenebrarius]|uniref:3-hydroxyacyl-CoA dehydrogenase / enoyl-CoA hydratase / 3-hydroxybutyryl-CoA epimerase n=1 Tax=Streptoalloteichus tenebrarius (strain ATCC 17920 / DSM 40477 / JCM 4838 / CBS 697.72 / NBRC 16177 / NCIMB 11028 / NRRL B-12390 / A12253. 1 / ISP 5477) TaxID=1933 RepID=A0ABT1HYY3_STRSD|nr:3-hydroxyacyl-CoA dehydrogenase NAD-binding domain-containing protein [Streptoalloteichus tenebrarius]MCP2260742.1 3-hydroxyacyl-CoA dehydrogenase / enoyl-CoA hydratase / 3-hydroxybutyryl-CoA epimerase [Streptoalloteichus tenebrarius]BFF03447.1 3-hydroxyacyl-CoA dehydrogenase NAD-binding domain-containing protein [Streptoalloteichus tenebrarius]